MYTVKITGTGTIVYKGRVSRLPATFPKIPKKELITLKTMCRSLGAEMEILEAEGERLVNVVQKIKDNENLSTDVSVIEETETKIEELFDSDDALGNLLDKLKKD